LALDVWPYLNNIWQLSPHQPAAPRISVEWYRRR